jgi:hypothetical protein
VKVNINITVEVDRDAYNEYFGDEANAAEIREYVKAAATAAAASELEQTGWAIVNPASKG